MKVLVYPYSPVSKSAKMLARRLGLRRMRHVGSKVNLKKTIILNWGAPNPPPAFHVYNRYASYASNKLKTFQALAANDVACVPFTAKRTEAHDWLTNGKRVFVRKLVNGHGGAGIENLYKKGYPWILDEVPEAPLYTLYIPKQAEYRVHVAGDDAILVQQKKKRAGHEVKDKFIRSHKNGYVFCKNDIDVPEGLVTLGIKAVKALHLDYGAVDIAFGKDGKLYVLEVNSAPGLDNATTEVYANAIKALL